MSAFFDHEPEPGESEYGGVSGPAGVAKYRPRSALSAADEARLVRLTGTRDPEAPLSDRVWRGEAIEKSAAQIAGEEAE